MHRFPLPTNTENATVRSMLVRRSRCAYEVGIPHSDGVLHADLTHEKAVHPSERKLHELDVFCLQMRSQWCCASMSMVTHSAIFGQSSRTYRLFERPIPPYARHSDECRADQLCSWTESRPIVVIDTRTYPLRRPFVQFQEGRTCQTLLGQSLTEKFSKYRRISVTDADVPMYDDRKT